LSIDDVYGGTQPTLKVTCIRSVAALAKEHNALLAVDNTFCSPYFQNPVDFGADIIVHSVTKYINGHSDVVGGVVCTNNEDVYKQLRFTQNGVGAVPSPFDCYLAHRGLKTLHLRMEAAARYVSGSDYTLLPLLITHFSWQSFVHLLTQQCKCHCSILGKTRLCE